MNKTQKPTAEIIPLTTKEAGKFPTAQTGKTPTAAAIIPISQTSKSQPGGKPEGIGKWEMGNGKQPTICAWSAASFKADREGFKAHLAQLTKTALRTLYKGEYKSWDHRKHAAKPEGHWHPAFEDVRDFLAYIGPKPSPEHTLDRINNNDPEYAPGKVKWSSKKEQNLNKGDTVFIRPFGPQGQAFTLEQVAEMQGRSKATLQKWRADGWSDAEIWAGNEGVHVHKARERHRREEELRAAGAPEWRIGLLKYNPWRVARENVENDQECIDPQAFIDCAVFEGLTFEEWTDNFQKLWKLYKPHMTYEVFAQLPEQVQRAIAHIDPEYSE